MNVSGLSINDIMDMSWNDLKKLDLKDLKQVTSRLVSASNKRIRRLAKSKRGTSSFAYQSVEERGRNFSVRGKDWNAVEQEFKLARNFLRMKTSTVKGWKEYRESMEERTGYATYGESQNWTENTWKKYWRVYRKFTENHGGTYKKGDSDRIQQMLTEIMASNDKRHNDDTFQKLIEDEYKTMYESQDDTQRPQDAFDVD